MQLQTTHGNINIELNCNWIHRACWNFIELCRRDYYDDCVFHRLVPGFCLQTGDPSGTGAGGESAWEGKAFRDEHDSRLLHDSRGVVSMANSGPNTNQSQFFISLDKASHLDYKHTIFGKVVGGMATVDRIEAIGSDKNEKPLQPVKLLKTVVFTNPVEEADQLLMEDIKRNMKKRLESTAGSALPQQRSLLQSNASSSAASGSGTASATVTSSADAPAKSSFSFAYTTSSKTTTGTPSSSSSAAAAVPGNAVPSKAATTGSVTVLSAPAPSQATNDAAIEAFLKSQAQRLGGSMEPEKRQKSGFGNFSNW